MPIPILMPALSPTMSEGKVVKWLKREGDWVRRGEVIAEVETDKAILEVEATEEGTLGKILAEEGGVSVAVDEPIAILFDGDVRDRSASHEATEGIDETADTHIAAKEMRAPRGPDGPCAAPSGAPRSAAGSQPRRPASPLARRLARERGIELRLVEGSGPRGRIVRADVERATRAAAEARSVEQPTPAEVYTAATFRAVPHTATRKTIARRLSESKATIPHFYLTVDCELDALLRLRERLNQRSGGDRLSINDFVVRAAALALREHPAVNASWTDDAIHYYDDVDIAVAVASPEGLITPIVQDADLKNLMTISKEMKDLALRARERRLRPEEFQGGSFTVSNLGMYGIKEFQAIINPPQAAVLAVGQAEPRAVVHAGALESATVMTCSLSCDHRVIDGAASAQFLRAVQRLLTEPARLYP